jgi:hypothetical protein
MAAKLTDARRGWRWAVSCVVWATYGLSLALPVMPEPMQEGEWFLGYEALLVSLDPQQPFWPVFANVALLAGWVGYVARQQALALVGGIAGLVLSASTLWFLRDPGSAFLMRMEDLAQLKSGYWMWVAAMAAFALAAAYEFFRAEK